MKLDAVSLRAMVSELGGILRGATFQKISQVAEEDYLFTLRLPGRTLRLLASLRNDESRLHLVEQASQAQVPSAFTMLLRKHLEGRRLEHLVQEGLERVVELQVPAYESKPAYSLILEIPGKGNNLALVDAHKRVLGLHRRSERIRPGQAYRPPPPSQKPDASTLNSQQLKGLLDPDRPRAQAMVEAVFGLPLVYAQQIEDWDAFWAELESGPYRGTVLPDGQLSFRPTGQPGERVFASLTEAAQHVWAPQSAAPGLEQQRGEVLQRLRKLSQKLQRRQGELQKDLREAEQAEKLRHHGELLLARLHEIEGPSARVRLQDFDEVSEVEIALDPRRSPAENAQRMFKRYRKLLRAQPLIRQQLERVSAELDHVEELKLSAEQATEAAELSALPTTPRAPGVKRPARPEPGPRRYRLDGFELLVGRNPTQNDKLTHRVAAREDLWFHARNIPGAHVILRTAGRTASQSAIFAAAVLAARHSKAADSSKVPVDWTQVKYVKKPPGSPPGKAIYKNELNMTVDPCAPVEGLEVIK